MRTIVQLAVLVAGMSLADAEPTLVVTGDHRVQLARHVIIDDLAASGMRADSRVVYLNKNGVTLTPGPYDSSANRSWLVSQPTIIPPWDISASLWDETVGCLHELFARFDIRITDTDPGDVPHIEAVFGGSPALFNLGPRVAGVAPFSTTCGNVEHAIVHAFTDLIGDRPRFVCEVMAQEIGHAYGLDHELLAADPMSYLEYSGARAFQDVLADCGESEARPCGLAGWEACRQQQNSVELLYERVGAAGDGDAVAPNVTITSPAQGATVAAGFEIVAAISDNSTIRVAAAAIDGITIGTRVGAPWTFTTSPDLKPGTYRVTVTATDGPNRTSDTIEVTVPGSDNGAAIGCSAGAGNSAFPLVALALLAALRSFHRPRSTVV